MYSTKEEKGGRLGYNLVANHAFIDGNKRMGIHIMILFLEDAKKASKSGLKSNIQKIKGRILRNNIKPSKLSLPSYAERLFKNYVAAAHQYFFAVPLELPQRHRLLPIEHDTNRDCY